MEKERLESAAHDKSADPAMPRASLVGVKGAYARIEFQLLAPSLSIGRLASNDIQLDDDKVSSVHGRILYRDGEFILRDMRSRNGIFVGGDRIERCVLVPGDLIQIGDTLFRFEVEGAKNRRRRRRAGGASALRYAVFGVLALFVLLIALAKPSGKKRGGGPGGLQGTPSPAVSVDKVREEILDRLRKDDASVKVKARNAEALSEFRMGVLYMDQKKYRQAVDAFTRALEIEPDWDVAKLRRTQARAELEKAIEDSYRRGFREFQALRYKEAIVAWEYMLFLAGDDHEKAAEARQMIEEAKRLLEGDDHSAGP